MGKTELEQRLIDFERELLCTKRQILSCEKRVCHEREVIGELVETVERIDSKEK